MRLQFFLNKVFLLHRRSVIFNLESKDCKHSEQTPLSADHLNFGTNYSQLFVYFKKIGNYQQTSNVTAKNKWSQ